MFYRSPNSKQVAQIFRIPIPRLKEECLRSCDNSDQTALSLAVLTVLDSEVLQTIWFESVKDTDILSAYVQVIRSGAVGRRSFGTKIKHLIQEWLNQASVDVLRAGCQDCLSEVIRLTHPSPCDKEHRDLFASLTRRPTLLPWGGNKLSVGRKGPFHRFPSRNHPQPDR